MKKGLGAENGVGNRRGVLIGSCALKNEAVESGVERNCGTGGNGGRKSVEDCWSSNVADGFREEVERMRMVRMGNPQETAAVGPLGLEDRP